MFSFFDMRRCICEGLQDSGRWRLRAGIFCAFTCRSVCVCVCVCCESRLGFLHVLSVRFLLSLCVDRKSLLRIALKVYVCVYVRCFVGFFLCFLVSLVFLSSCVWTLQPSFSEYTRFFWEV